MWKRKKHVREYLLFEKFLAMKLLKSNEIGSNLYCDLCTKNQIDVDRSKISIALSTDILY